MKNHLIVFACIAILFNCTVHAGKGKGSQGPQKSAVINLRVNASVADAKESEQHYLVDKKLFDEMSVFLNNNRLRHEGLRQTRDLAASARRWAITSSFLSASVLGLVLYDIYFTKDKSEDQEVCAAITQNTQSMFWWWNKTLFNSATLAVSTGSLAINAIIYWDKIRNFWRRFA